MKTVWPSWPDVDPGSGNAAVQLGGYESPVGMVAEPPLTAGTGTPVTNQ